MVCNTALAPNFSESLQHLAARLAGARDGERSADAPDNRFA
jgi:hypothetical protein